MRTRINSRIFLFQLAVLVVVLSLSFVFDSSADTAVGLSMAVTGMMNIGDIEDVSDRQTHGSNIAYQIYLISIDQVDNSQLFPAPNANREVGQVPMKNGEYMKYFVCHTIPTFVGNGEKGDITTSGTNQFVAVMGGQRDKLLSFTEEYAGGKFIILFKEIEESQWYIIGSYDRPMILQTFENKHDADGRYVTLHSSVLPFHSITNIQVLLYVSLPNPIRWMPLILPLRRDRTCIPFLIVPPHLRLLLQFPVWRLMIRDAI
jgi:hypothetical protein